jgi:exonuclease III
LHNLYLYPKSVKSKIPYLADLAKETNALYICITETHLTPEVLDAEILIPGYNLFRSDRSGRTHGGVATYVRKELLVKNEIKDSNSFGDSLAITIPQLNLVIINIYRPPNCPEIMFNQTMEYLSVFLRNMEEGNKCALTYLVLGDFIFPFLKFSDQDKSSFNLQSCSKCEDTSNCSHTMIIS